MPRAPSLEVGRKIILHTIKSGILSVFCFFCISIVIVGSSGAVSLSEQFINNDSFTEGLIVSLDKENPDKIVLSDLTNSNYLLGVVAEDGVSSVTFAKDGSDTNVALDGVVSVLVSDENGVISKGDFISASWLQGVGMKSDEISNQKLVGVALEDFDAEKSLTYGDIDTPTGTQSVQVSSIQVQLFDKEGPIVDSANTEGVEGVFEKIVGKRISFTKVLAGSLILIVSISIAGVFIASAIRGSFVSIGRNPLASTSIYKSLIHVSGLSVLVILIGAALSYVVLVI